jgi:hypothetical protein
MDTPKPVMRNGIMTYEMPELIPKGCSGCRMHDSHKYECKWDRLVDGDEKYCADRRIIYIEATPEAYATYITQRIQKGLQS